MSDEEAKIWNHHLRQVYQKELRWLKTKQGKFESTMLHFDHPLPGIANLYLQASDNGIGAEKIRSAMDPIPFWLKLWRRKRLQLKPKRRRIHDALILDWRTVAAARIACVSARTVITAKTFFKMHFNQCYQAWKALFR